MQQLTKHTSVVQQPAAVKPRTIEIGFRFSKDFDGLNPPRLVNTVVGTLEGRLNKRPKGTIEVELLSSTSQSQEIKEIIGKRFIVGPEAIRKNGKPLFLCGADAKVQFGLPVVLALLGSNDPFQLIPHLLLSLPDAGSAKEFFGEIVEDHERLIELVTGKHTFKWNGYIITRQVEAVQCFYEGEGMRDWGIWHGLVPEESGLLIVDLGGKTANLVPLDADGEVIAEYHDSFSHGGTLDLANRIVKDEDFKARFGSGVKHAEVMDAIAKASRFATEQGEEIDPILGTGYNAKSFQDVFLRCREQWIDGILGELDSRFRDKWNLFGRALFGGGSAHLLSERLEGQDYFVVVPTPETAHLKGLTLRFAPQLAQKWVEGSSNG